MAKLNDQMIENGNSTPESVTKPEVESNTQMFDVNSDYWNQIFKEDPTPEKLFETQMESYENFFSTGLYLFVSDVRNGKHKLMNIKYEPGNAVGEPLTCLTNKDVFALQTELNRYQSEFNFWMNFNEWAEEVYYSNYADPTNFLPNMP